MKGIISSLIVLIAFLSGLFVVIVFANSVQESYDIVSMNAVGDRVFYKFAAIENSIIRIIENDLNQSSLNIAISEGTFNLVTINMSIPSTSGNFSSDLLNFERFAERYLNESRLVVDLNMSNVASCLPLEVIPYNITYGAVDGSQSNCGFGAGQRDLKILPGGVSPGLINGYGMVIVANRTRINPSSASWTPSNDCTGGDLNWTVYVRGNNTVYGPVTQMIDKDGKCVFRIDENVTGNKIIQVNNKPQNQDPDATMVVTVQPGFNVSFAVTLNLTDIPGKTGVGLSPQSIKIRETLFQVERNDTVVIK